MAGAVSTAATVGMASASFGGGLAISAWGYPVLFAGGAALVSLAALLLWSRFCGMPWAHACRLVVPDGAASVEQVPGT